MAARRLSTGSGRRKGLRVPSHRSPLRPRRVALIAGAAGAPVVLARLMADSTDRGLVRQPGTGPGATGGPPALGVTPTPTARRRPSASPRPPARRADPPEVPSGFRLLWSPAAARDGLRAFEGMEDDRAHSHPGVRHIYVQGNTFRFECTSATGTARTGSATSPRECGWATRSWRCWTGRLGG